MRRIWLLLCCLVTLSGLCGPALAHASLLSSTPAQGAVLAAAPKIFTLAFSEPVSPMVLTLVGPDGTKAKLTEFRLVGNDLEITPPEGLGNGTSVINYRIISADGHPVGGAIIFSIGAPGGGAADAGEAVDWTLRAVIWVGRVALYGGLFFGIGGVFFRSFVAGGTVAGRGFARIAVLAGLVAAVLSVELQGLDSLGLPLAALGRPDVWAAGIASSFGVAACLAFLSLGLALLADLMGGWWAKWGAGLALLGVGLALASTGHAAAAEPQWLTRPAVLVHAIAIAFWAGALVPLLLLLREASPEAGAALRRFSRIIPFALAPLIAAGIVLAIVQVETPQALVETDYGRVLLLKLALLVGVFGLAAFNRWRLTARVEQGAVAATRMLARIIIVETLLLFAVMGVAAVWRFTPPPRALVLLAETPLELHIHTDKAMADVSFASDRAGANSAEIVLLDGEFGPLDAEGLALLASNEAAGIEPVRYTAEKTADGNWRVDQLSLPRPGAWKIELEIRISDFQMVRISEMAALGP